MRKRKALVWTFGILWVAVVVALVRAQEFGFGWSQVPMMALQGSTWGAVGFLVVAGAIGDSMKNRLWLGLVTLCLGTLAGALYVEIDDRAFSKRVQSLGPGAEDINRARWFPLSHYTLASVDGECFAFRD